MWIYVQHALIIIGCIVFAIAVTPTERYNPPVGENAPLTDCEFKLIQDVIENTKRIEALETALRAHIAIGHIPQPNDGDME